MCHTTLALGTFGTPIRVDLPQEVPETLAASVPFPSRLGSPADDAPRRRRLHRRQAVCKVGPPALEGVGRVLDHGGRPQNCPLSLTTAAMDKMGAQHLAFNASRYITFA
jgi:hypothetical protein